MSSGTDWIAQARGLLELLAQGPHVPSDGDAPASDCRWCPVCRSAAVVRGDRPEVTAALADVLTATATALRVLAETGRPGPPGAGPAPTAEDTGGAGEPPPVVQRIEIA